VKTNLLRLKSQARAGEKSIDPKSKPIILLLLLVRGDEILIAF